MITRKNDAFDAKIVNTRLTKIFIAIFAPDERLPSSATLIRNHITLLFEPVDADEALFVRTQSLVHWDVACVWSQTRCLTKCETITSLGMCGVCQKDNVTLSRRLLCKSHLSALLLISLVNAVDAARIEDVLPENVCVNICFNQIYPKYVCCKYVIDKYVDCLNNRRKRTIRKKRRRRGTWRAVSPPGWSP